MDASTIAQLKPRLGRFLGQFDDCFGRPEPAAHLRTYVAGQLSDLPRKSIEPMALCFGTPPRTLQQFLAAARWDHDRATDKLQQQVAARWSHPDAVGIFDETSHPKKGDRTPGVKHQYCGARGKQDNCAVSVHLAYAAPGGFRVLLDGELFLPQDWSQDRARCDKAGIPQTMAYRPKWKIALELRDRAVANGVVLPWVTFDEGYGLVPEFHAGLNQRGQAYVGEVPCNFFGWCKEPVALLKNHHPSPDGDSAAPRLKVKSPAASRVDDLAAHSPAFGKQPWERFRVNDSTKGPIVWEARRSCFWISSGGLPGRPQQLIVARNVLKLQEIKYFVSNAAANTPLKELLRVGFGRYPVERCFEDDKTEIGLDHFEVRNYRSLKRHLIVSAMSLLFLAQVRQEDGAGKKAN
jgi:SRSO17 transposase